VFHSAAENPGDLSPQHFLGLFHEARVKDPDTVFKYRGERITQRHVFHMAKAMADHWPDILEGVDKDMRDFGIIPVGREVRVEVKDGPDYPITTHGTMDIETALGFADIKTTGLHDPIISAAFNTRSRSANKVTLQPQFLLASFQMRMYSMLFKIKNGVWPEFIYIIAPANASRYKKTGERKGKTVFFSQTNQHLMETFEQDFVALIKGTVEGGFFRRMPETFGKSDCPTCPYFEPCIISDTHVVTEKEYEESIFGLYNTLNESKTST